MLTVFGQVLLLFIFAVAGYILARTGRVSPSQSGVLSKLLVYLFLPCNVIKTFNKNFTVPYITANGEVLLVSVLVLIGVILITEIIVRGIDKEKYRRAIWRYSLVVPNLGYMGWPLVGALYGEEMMLLSMIYSLPAQIYIYTYGYAALTKGGLKLKSLLNPTVISLAVGILLGLTGIRLPDYLLSVMDKASACMAPISMILAGIVISEYNPRELIGDVRVWIVTACRLLLFPAAISLVLRPFAGETARILAVLMSALPCGLNTIVFPKLVEEDCKPGAALGLLSNILACATIPLCLMLLI